MEKNGMTSSVMLALYFESIPGKISEVLTDELEELL